MQACDILLFGRKNFEIWEIHFWGVIEFPQWSGYANVPFTMEFVAKRMYDLKVLFNLLFWGVRRMRNIFESYSLKRLKMKRLREK